MRSRLFDVAVSQVGTIDALIEKTVAAGGDPEREPIPPELEDIWPPWWLEVISEDDERDEYEALREGLRDLERLLLAMRNERGRDASGLFARLWLSN